MEKEDSKFLAWMISNIIVLSTGIATGCLIMFLVHKDALRHYTQCQEQQLLETIAELKTEKSWYIKEDKNGKLNVQQYSMEELMRMDSLTEVTAIEE